MDALRVSEIEARRLVDTYADLILRLSFTYLKSTHDAEDLCQTVFLKLMTSAPHFENAQHEKAWIIRTTLNASKDVLRSGFRRKSVRMTQMPEFSEPAKPESDVIDAVMALPRKYREAIYLYYFEGYSIKEIASLVHRSEDAVSAHLSRGRAKLRTELKGVYCEQRI